MFYDFGVQAKVSWGADLEQGVPQGWGNLLEDVGGTSAGGVQPLTFKKLSKNPSRTSLVREIQALVNRDWELLS